MSVFDSGSYFDSYYRVKEFYHQQSFEIFSSNQNQQLAEFLSLLMVVEFWVFSMTFA